MQIRQATTDDAAAIVDDLWMPFAEELAELDEYNALASDIRSDAIEYREEKLAQSDYCVQLAVEDGAFVGFASGRVKSSPPVFERGAALAISELYVRPDWRRQGVASSLLDALEAWGDERGYETVSLSVNADNDAAKALYESVGFEVKRVKMVKRGE